MTSDDAEISHAATGRDGLAAQLRELEAFAERSEASGDDLPPEAIEMIARLREIVQALDGLTSSMAERDQPPDTDAPPGAP
ncbi:MAG: hypothetical protein ABIP93_01910 [Gemmatimonadaceae bacterium]